MTKVKMRTGIIVTTALITFVCSSSGLPLRDRKRYWILEWPIGASRRNHQGLTVAEDSCASDNSAGSS